MHAITLEQPGGPEVLRWSEVPDPGQPGPGEVLLDVVATAVNRADLQQRMGFYPPPPGASELIGLECSGTVAAVGGGVTGWSTGDQACALLAGGGYATKVLIPAGQLMPIPDGVDLVEAAALPEVACTVWSNLIWKAHLSDGETLLVHGGSSGIGTMAIQLVRALRPKARIAVTAGSAAKLERCRELGADIAINYRDEDFVARMREETGGHGADVVLDNMGATYLTRNVEVLAADGRLIILGLQGGRKAELDLGVLLPKRASIAATSLRGRPAEQKAEVCAGVVREVWPAVTDGRIRPIIDRRLSLADAAEAHRVVDESGHIGKVLLVVPGQNG